jgi:hypothetical protein
MVRTIQLCHKLQVVLPATHKGDCRIKVLKVLIISPAFAPFSGVGAVRMTSLAKYLVACGDSVTVMRYTPSIWGRDTLKTSQPEGIEYIDVAPKSPVTMQLLTRMLKS